jgi:anti-sigma B factor antagonist
MVSVRRQADATIIDVHGDLDILSSVDLTAAIATAADGSDPLVVASLEQCTFCDSSGLAALAVAKKRLGIRLKVVVPKGGHVRHVFDITELTEYLSLYGTVEEALAAYDSPR